MKRYTPHFWAHLSLAWGLILTLTALSGCGVGGYGCGAGYAVNNAALELTSVTDSRTGAAISHVTLSGLTFDGSAITDLQSLTPNQLTHGVTVAGNTLICDVPCTFGLNAGLYQFTVSATGYKTVTKEFKGAPLFDHTPCPISTVGSTRIKFTLDPL